MSGTRDPIRVLHVDDIVDVAEVTEAHLERENRRIEVVTAVDAEEGYEVLAEREIHCVVSDYDMPGKTGIEFLQGVREQCADLPFILYTGKGSEEVASEAISAGVTDYLQKGTGTDQYTLLANRIENAVDQTRAEAAAAKRERRLQTVLDNLPYPAFVVDEDGTYRLSNEAHAAFHGARMSEIEGMDAERLLTADEYEQFETSLQTVIEHGEQTAISEVEIENAGGETRVLDTRLIPLEPVETDKQVVLGVTVDVTEQVAQRREIEAKRRQLQAVLDTAPAGIFMKRPDGEYVLFNETAREWTGVDPDAAVADLSDEEVFPDQFVEKARADDERVFEAGETVEVEETVPMADGTRTYRTRKRPLYDEDGDPEAVCAVSVDVTDRHERERELERYEGMVEAMRDAACIYDADGRFVALNEYLADFYGTTQTDLEGTKSPLVERVRAEGDRDPFAELVAGEREQFRGEYESEFPDHGTAVVDLRLTRLTVDGEFGGIVGIGRDVTDYREHQRELERKNERLEEFASVVSHDLRNPLDVATGRVELARDDCDSEHLPVAARSLDRMAALIDDLLALARGSERSIDPRPVDLASLARQCWTAIGAEWATLELAVDDDIVADLESVRQLLENLLDNAVSHGSGADAAGGSTDASPELTVRVGTLPEGGFYVADDGPGIPPEERDSVFDAGYSTADGGTGFGLRIVERAAESHGWEVDVTDSLLGGARFEVRGVAST